MLQMSNERAGHEFKKKTKTKTLFNESKLYT